MKVCGNRVGETVSGEVDRKGGVFSAGYWILGTGYCFTRW